MAAPVTDTDTGATILAALTAACAAKITASIGLDAFDDDDDADGYSITITVMVDGFGDHHGADLFAAAADLERRVAEAIAARQPAAAAEAPPGG